MCYIEPSKINLSIIMLVYTMIIFGCMYFRELAKPSDGQDFAMLSLILVLIIAMLSSCGTLRHNGCPVSNTYVGYGGKK